MNADELRRRVAMHATINASHADGLDAVEVAIMRGRVEAYRHVLTMLDEDERGYYTLTDDDVGHITIHAFGKTWPVSGFLGRVLFHDVGKRVYLRGDFLQAENDEQRNARERVQS